MKKTLLSTAAVGLSLGLMGSVAHAAPKITAQSIIVNPVQTDVGVKVWTDRDSSGSQTPNYVPGDNIRIFTQVSRDAYVYLFNVDPNGQVDMILPNRYAGGANFVKANTVKAFPGSGDGFTFDIAAPYGLNKVLALASLTPLDTSAIASFRSSQDRFATVNVQGQQQLAQALSIVVNPVSQPIPQNSWVTDVAYYNVAQGYANQPQPGRPVWNTTPSYTQPAPVTNVPVWRSQPRWNTQFQSRQDIAQVYIQYANELQNQGYRLVRRNNQGNAVSAVFQGSDQAELVIRVRGDRYDIQIIRR